MMEFAGPAVLFPRHDAGPIAKAALRGGAPHEPSRVRSLVNRRGKATRSGTRKSEAAAAEMRRHGVQRPRPAAASPKAVAAEAAASHKVTAEVVEATADKGAAASTSAYASLSGRRVANRCDPPRGAHYEEAHE